jgi:RNA polymerase primary sigma factor
LLDSSTNEHSQEDENKSLDIVLLIEHGRRKSYLSRGDVLDIVPDAEFDAEQMQAIRTKLSEAGISYVDEDGEEAFPPEAQPEGQEWGEADGDPLPELDRNDIGIDILEGVETDDMVRLYVKEAAQIPLLTAEEEIELAKLIDRCRLAQEELARGQVRTQRKTELQRIIQDGRFARDRMIRANARLVISVARKYLGRGLPFLDLIQEGNIGLMRAIRNFDYRRGFKFSTYATWWIRQAITRALADQGRTIRLPVHMSDDVNRMLRIQSQLQQTLGRKPTSEELAEAMEVTPAKIVQMIEIVKQPLSLQAPVGEEEDEELGNLIQDADAPDPEESAIQMSMSEDLQKRLDTLPSRELEVIQYRYGLKGETPMTLSDVGRKLGITRERARQLEVQALQRLRNPSARRKRRTRNS